MTDEGTPTTRDDSVLEVERAIVELYRTVNERIRGHAKTFNPDLQPVGFGILRYIRLRESIRAAEISTALGMDKSSVSRQITALREMGLVETRPDPEDGRASLLVLSEASRIALAGIRDDTAAEYERALSTWTDDDVQTFAGLLKKFTAQL